MTNDIPFQLVLLGADIGTYALARSWHEQWGTRAAVVTLAALGPVRDSQILDLHVVTNELTDLDAPAPLIDALLKLGPRFQEQYAGKKLILLANIDSNIRDILARKEQLEQYYTCALPSEQIVAMTNDKTEFPAVAAKYGLQVPATHVIDLGADTDSEDAAISAAVELGVTYPVIIKPALGYGYERLEWPGKAKVYTATDPAQTEHILRDLAQHTRSHPRARRFVLQPRVEGNDSFNLSVTAYVDQHHRVTMLGSAQVLLEDHSPTALGNPAAMITEAYPALYDQVRSFLEGVGWHGYANFDFKVDCRSGEVFCFEVNPRIGRNSYYNTAAGMNPLPFMVRDLIFGEKVPPVQLRERVYYSILPTALVLRYVDKTMKKKVRFLHRAGRAVDPMFYPAAERGFSRGAWWRWSYVRLARLNHWRKFHRNYPVAVFRQGPTASLDTAKFTK